MQYRIYQIDQQIPNYRRTKFLIPDICPNCGKINNPQSSIEGHTHYSGFKIIYMRHHCPSCQKDHWSIQKVFPDSDDSDPQLLTYTPSNSLRQFEKRISDFSPRFVDMYHQAEQAENNGNIELAGIGYRAAEEILIKDFAVKFSSDDVEKVSKYTLNSAIGHYFKDSDALGVSADVVRINGNDYAHWNRPQNFDTNQKLQELKAYLDIFISQINVKLMIKNPPVSRNHKSNK